MDKLMEQMMELARQYPVKKLVLFGSRARGDHRADSDYDFALWGVPTAEQSLLRDAVEEQIQSLLKIDLVFVSEDTSAALKASIEKDGVVLMDKFEIKFENFKNALCRLEEGLAAYAATPGNIVRDGVIQRFEFTCELAWKTAREYLLDQGHVDLNSPKAVMKQAFADGLVQDNEGWVSLLNDRNLTSHIYDEATAEQIFSAIQNRYAQLFTALLKKLEQ